MMLELGHVLSLVKFHWGKRITQVLKYMSHLTASDELVNFTHLYHQHLGILCHHPFSTSNDCLELGGGGVKVLVSHLSPTLCDAVANGL